MTVRISRASILPQRLDQRRDVEDVAQHLAVGLEDHRERAELRRHGEQVRRALSLLPERRAAAGTAPRQQQRARRRLAELRGEQRRAAELPHDQRFRFVRRRQQQRGIGRRLGLRET